MIEKTIFVTIEVPKAIRYEWELWMTRKYFPAIIRNPDDIKDHGLVIPIDQDASSLNIQYIAFIQFKSGDRMEQYKILYLESDQKKYNNAYGKKTVVSPDTVVNIEEFLEYARPMATDSLKD